MRCAHGKRMCPTIYVTGCGSASAQLQTRRQQSRARGTAARWAARAWYARRQWARRPRARRRRACARTTRCAAARHAHAPLCDSGVSAPPRTSMPAAAGRRRTPLTRRGSEASPAPASTSRGRMGRRRGERRGQTCAGARAPWAGRARSSAFERSAYRRCCRRCCRRCWPTNSERGRRGPWQRKHPLRSPARERRAAGAAAPGEADERRQRPLDNLRPTGAARQQVATSGREARARGGSGSGGRHPPRSGASAWPRLGARGRAPRREMEKSRHASAQLA